MFNLAAPRVRVAWFASSLETQTTTRLLRLIAESLCAEGLVDRERGGGRSTEGPTGLKKDLTHAA